MQEYGWLTVSESFLAMTIFRDEFDARFIFLFSSLLALKALHWIARDRVDYMEQTAQLPPRFNARMLATILLMVTMDVAGLWVCIQSVIRHGPSMAILFGNEVCLSMVRSSKVSHQSSPVVRPAGHLSNLHHCPLHAQHGRYSEGRRLGASVHLSLLL